MSYVTGPAVRARLRGGSRGGGARSTRIPTIPVLHFVEDASDGTRSIDEFGECLIEQTTDWDDSAFKPLLEKTLRRAPFGHTISRDQWSDLPVNTELVAELSFLDPNLGASFDQVESLLAQNVGVLLESIGLYRTSKVTGRGPH